LTPPICANREFAFAVRFDWLLDKTKCHEKFTKKDCGLIGRVRQRSAAVWAVFAKPVAQHLLSVGTPTAAPRVTTDHPA
jgi:hypothetical protein